MQDNTSRGATIKPARIVVHSSTAGPKKSKHSFREKDWLKGARRAQSSGNTGFPEPPRLPLYRPPLAALPTTAYLQARPARKLPANPPAVRAPAPPARTPRQGRRAAVPREKVNAILPCPFFFPAFFSPGSGTRIPRTLPLLLLLLLLLFPRPRIRFRCGLFLLLLPLLAFSFVSSCRRSFTRVPLDFRLIFESVPNRLGIR